MAGVYVVISPACGLDCLAPRQETLVRMSVLRMSTTVLQLTRPLGG